LFTKYDKVYPDSVWFDGFSFRLNYPNVGFEEEMIPIKGENSKTAVDSIINTLRKEPKLLLRETSKFYLALDSIQQSDSLIIDYLNAKQAVGHISQASLVDGLLSNYDYTTDYFSKRIFIIDSND
jgi:hypothetical protein